MSRSVSPLSVLLHLHRPARLGRGPRRAHDALAVADVLVDAVLAGRLADVGEDRGPVGDRLCLVPRLERVAEREHVRVRADAGVAEQVPRAADAPRAPRGSRSVLPGQSRLQVAGGADAGEAGADDQHVEVFRLHGRSLSSGCGRVRRHCSDPRPSVNTLSRTLDSIVENACSVPSMSAPSASPRARAQRAAGASPRARRGARTRDPRDG